VRRASGALLGVCLLSTAAHAGDVAPDVDIVGESPTGDREPSARKVAIARFEEIPVAEIPEPLDDADRPQRLASGASAPDLRIATQKPVQWKRWLSLHRSTAVQIKPQSEGFGMLSWVSHGSAAWGATPSLETTCEKGGKVSGWRWETFRLEEDGKAALEIRDGWFDPDNCSLSVVRRTKLHPKELASERGMPLVFAVRGAQSLTLMLAPGASIAVADLVDAARDVKGAVERITVPIQRGASAAVAVTLAEQPLAAWLAAATGNAAPVTGQANGEISLGVDAVQGVGEKSPTILLQTQAVAFSEKRIIRKHRVRMRSMARPPMQNLTVMLE
jgi:hypothetical protein